MQCFVCHLLCEYISSPSAWRKASKRKTGADVFEQRSQLGLISTNKEDVYMITEWLSFCNEIHSRVKFVLHSHDKIERLSLRRSRSRGFRARLDTHVPLPKTTRIKHDLRFSIQNEVRFQFAWYQNEISYHNENLIWKKKPEWSHFGMTCTATKFRFGIL